MGDLAVDAALTEGPDGSFVGTLSRDWEIWGPNGGYMAAFALEAARRSSGRARPANATVHFLGVASFDAPIEVTATVQRATRQATSVRVEIGQAGKPVLAAMVWALDGDLDGLEHDDAAAPDVPVWSDLPTIAERFAAAGLDGSSRYDFWNRFEQRPALWIDDWDTREPEPALWQVWLRYLEGGPATDPWIQAARLLLLVDLGAWPSIQRRHLGDQWVAPSIDVSCEFHRPATGDEWFLTQGTSAHASDGLVASHQTVWNDRGQLLASGISHLFCRRVG